ncbi:hypothetical protein F2Q70_00031492 [Brassica cretica]|uniref:Uncharacterized protein n=1 Tax=Brassica cretica TaxID=69181 RepID=A0A8S9FP61_BRACR|nr:hypothetical protein F2Q70_00031492 [Brassica cretica]KAF3592515.1 hypothetical protein DY000_02024707 [Brassica cretica]
MFRFNSYKPTTLRESSLDELSVFDVTRSSTNFRCRGSPFATRFIEQTMYVQIAEYMPKCSTSICLLQQITFSLQRILLQQTQSYLKRTCLLNLMRSASEKSIEKKVISEAGKKGLQAFHWRDYCQIRVLALCLEEIIHLAKRKKKKRSYGYDSDV